MLLLFTNIVSASRQLENDEILEIVKTLTDQSISTWIPYGTIKGTHIEYSASDGSIVESTEQVKYDGNRFSWEIDISLEKMSKNLAKDLSTDLKKNANRVFIWDGDRYSMYFATTNNAMIYEGYGQIPVDVNGPLTAGIIPWGFGVYTYANLSAAKLSAMENYKGQIVLAVKEEDMPEMEFLLDPSRNYAVLTYWFNNDQGDTIFKKDYSEFKSAGSILIPTNIVVERYDTTKSSPDMVSRDEWDITSFDLNIPKQSEFTVPYRKSAFVEFHPSSDGMTLSYHFSDSIDTEELFEKRLEIAFAGNSIQPQNCATIALGQAFSQLGKELTDQQLGQLVGADNSTSLYDMRQVALDSDLNATAVITDIKTLRKLKDCQIILYLPKAKHYVVLENIDSKYAWLIDLDSNKFYYRTSLDNFKYLWDAGIALLISEKSFDKGEKTEIADNDLKEIKGSTGGGIPKYSCDDIIQEKEPDRLCADPIGGNCGGNYWKWVKRYGCIENEEGGKCTGSNMIGQWLSSCKEDTSNPTICTLDNSWFSRDIRACK